MAEEAAQFVIAGIPLKGRIVYEPVEGSYRHRKVHKPWAHQEDCVCEPEHTFMCDRCGRIVGWCLGCWDNMPGSCDFCWKPPKEEIDAHKDST